MNLATITHNLTLSTTDFNLVGDIKVRQADDETIVFDSKILEHGLVKNFDGLKPFFCLMAREITGQGISEEPVKTFDSKKGTLQYTLSANALQMVGRNEAYFSFRKELTNGSWAEQFSTRSFYYTVEKSIYTQPFKDSNYWFTFKELYRLFNEYIDSGKLTWEDFMDTESNNWKEFLEQNKEILESIDPGGVVLSELVRSRKPAEYNEAYPDLPTRLDEQIGKTSDFRSFEADKSFMNRVYNEFSEREANVKWFGAVGDGVADDTEAIRRALTRTHKIFFPPGNYLIKLDALSKEELYSFVNSDSISIHGEDATIVDDTEYTISQLNNIFSFDGCRNISVNIGYKGKVNLDPENTIDSIGATFLYFERKSKNITIKSIVKNARYGIRTGDYLRPDLGHCSDFDITITGEMVGYPVAAYYADNIDASVSVDGIHRGLYLAGINGGNIISRCKNNYGQFTHILLTNCITSWHETDIQQRLTRGCANITIDVSDNGSTKMHPNAMLCQISPSWASPGTAFENITVNFSVISRNQLSDVVGGFSIQSAVKSVRPEYPYNFEPHMRFVNIRVNGHINRLAQTTSTNSLGEIFVRTYDSDDTNFSHCPTVDGLYISVTYLKGAQQSRSLYIDCPKGKDIILSDSDLTGINISLSGENCKIINSKANNVTSYDTIENLFVTQSSIASIDYNKISSVKSESFSLSPFNKRQLVEKKLIVFNGGKTFVIPNAFSRGDIILNIMLRFSGYKVSGTYSVGTNTNPDYFGTASINTSSGYNRFSTSNLKEDSYGKLFTQNSDLVITFNLTSGTDYPTVNADFFLEKILYTVD